MTPEGAKAILEAAGWVDEDGDGIRERDGQNLAFHLDAASSSGYPKTGAIIQDHLSEIGFDVSISTQDFASLAAEKLYPQTFDAFLVSFTWSQPAPHILTEILLGRPQRQSREWPWLDLLHQSRAGCAHHQRGREL